MHKHNHNRNPIFCRTKELMVFREKYDAIFLCPGSMSIPYAPCLFFDYE